MKILGINHAKIDTNSITEIQDDCDCYLRGAIGAAMFTSIGPPFTSPLHSPLQNLSGESEYRNQRLGKL